MGGRVDDLLSNQEILGGFGRKEGRKERCITAVVPIRN
jgi:hypothetical protein